MAEQNMWVGQSRRQPSRPSLPVRQENTDWHDRPAKKDPYLDQAWPVFDEDDEEGEEEEICDDGEEEEAEHDDGPPIGERSAPPWEPPAPAWANQPRRREEAHTVKHRCSPDIHR